MGWWYKRMAQTPVSEEGTIVEPGTDSFCQERRLSFFIDIVFLAPDLEQCMAARGIALATLHAGNTVDTEVAVIAAQFAPGRQQALAFKIRQGKWPHGALAGCTVLICISEGDFLFVT